MGLTRFMFLVALTFVGSHSVSTPWYQMAQLGTNVTLACLAAGGDFANSDKQVTWTIPNGERLSASGGDFIIEEMSGDLLVTGVNSEHFGWYLCTVAVSAAGPRQQARVQTFVSKALLQRTLTAEEEVEKFEKQLAVGAIVAGTLLGVFGLSCAVWKLRYRDKTDRHVGNAFNHKPSDITAGAGISETSFGKKATDFKNEADNSDDDGGHENPAFSHDDNSRTYDKQHGQRLSSTNNAASQTSAEEQLQEEVSRF